MLNKSLYIVAMEQHLIEQVHEVSVMILLEML